MKNAIASIGTDETFVELFLSKEGEHITLKAIATEWHAFTGAYYYTDIGEVDGLEEEEAEDAAVDLQGLAHEFLDAHEGRGWGKGFGEAVQAFLIQQERLAA